MNENVRALIAALDTDDGKALRHAGNRLLELGPVAVPALLDAARSEAPRLRKAATFLLGRGKMSSGVIETLGHALLDDPEPKVRKNAAISLGSLASSDGVDVLRDAFEREAVDWIRPSIILALGAIGGDRACAELRALSPRDEPEREALRKALDRCSSHTQSVDWRREAVIPGPVLLDVPVGLERIAIAEAVQHGIRPVVARPGLLRCPAEVQPWQVFPTLRCAFSISLALAVGKPIPFERPADCSAAVGALVRGSPTLPHIHTWLDAGDGPIRYRLSFEGQSVRRDVLRNMLDAVRAVLRPLGLEDSPSNYDIELIVTGDKKSSRLLLRPSFMQDTRFDYRQKDVGASINPVVAACLARAVYSAPGATVLDPTCGSGTLLIERMLLDDESRGLGCDISRTAVTAARTNVVAAGLDSRIKVIVADAMTAASWTACEEMIANLPFGLRTQREELDLPALYHGLVENLALNLKPGGRALLFSANTQLLETSVAAHKGRLRIVERLRVRSGGLWVAAWILTLRLPV